MNHGLAWKWTLRKSFWVVGNQQITRFLWSPFGGCWGVDALSACPAKVGGEWLAEVYGDLWLLPQTLISSFFVSRQGRPMVSCDQHWDSCRWAHQNALHWNCSRDKWCQGVHHNQTTNKDEEDRSKQRDSWPLNGSRTSTWPSETEKKELWAVRLYWCPSITEKRSDEIMRERNIWTWS